MVNFNLRLYAGLIFAYRYLNNNFILRFVLLRALIIVFMYTSTLLLNFHLFYCLKELLLCYVKQRHIMKYRFNLYFHSLFFLLSIHTLYKVLLMEYYFLIIYKPRWWSNGYRAPLDYVRSWVLAPVESNQRPENLYLLLLR